MYRCVLAPSYECDGCEECLEHGEERMSKKQIKAEYEADYAKEEAYIRSLEREDC